MHQNYTRTGVNSVLDDGYMSSSCCTLSSQQVLSAIMHMASVWLKITNYPNTFPSFSPFQATKVTIP